MAANIDLNRVPGKSGDPYRGQAVIHQGDVQGAEHKIKLPAIPDFRFESAYLSALKPFVTSLQDKAATNKPETVKQQLEEKGGAVSAVGFDYGVPIRINWSAVIWVTLRDQVIVQFVTGGIYATWAIFATPFFKNVRAGLGSLFSFPRSGGHLRQPPQARSSSSWPTANR
ncbi:hypothetical protein M408DRAFT_325832 [Serendipita vermifera MAFF 305830]|uniref:Uncharacterized protein n=1 Tax=Serendipita vermifera MAFF 305830 TaxID=933852 RepID=A0A0C3BC74_SERVB|nr:hypothetical protein M408DRAFT_325832 [Serendipita vermifera MAFF 305830]